MNEENLCDKCPDGIRGLCCYYSITLEGYNLILLNQPCKFLDKETMKCNDYEHRLENNPNCLQGKSMFNNGGLPKGCLYLKDHPEREENPKIKPYNIIQKLSQESILTYNVLNNINNIEQYALKRDDE